MKHIRVAMAAAVLMACMSANAFAAPLSAPAILQDFNAVIFGNATTPSDIEGAAVIGGDFSGATLDNKGASSLPTGYGALTVFGSTTGNDININNGGDAYVAGSKGAHINFNDSGAYIAAPGSTISDFEAPLDALSASLATMTATGALPTAGNNEVITATPVDGVAVFDITAADLAAIPSYKIDLNGADTVIFNVSGSSVSFNANDETGDLGADNIIWNFYQADSVSLGTQIAGTVLAVGANVSNANQIDGDLIAASLTGSGELHDYAFTGKLPVSAAPEPASWALMLLGIGGLGLALRARRRDAVAA